MEEIIHDGGDKIVIDKEMLDSFLNMFNSTDTNDCKLAIDVLNNRNKDDQESENNFNQIKNKIINTQTLFPSIQYSGHFVIKTYEGKIINLAQKSYNSQKSAMRGLEYYLRKAFRWYGNHNVGWKALKFIFGDHKVLQKFLFDNNIIKVVELK